MIHQTSVLDVSIQPAAAVAGRAAGSGEWLCTAGSVD
jgi:hypothetical protein